MKIVIGVTYSYPYIGSGIGNVAMKQAEELASRGHKVTIISSNHPKYKNEFVKNKVKYLKGNILLRMEKIGLPIPLFFLTKEMKKTIKEADIVHIHGVLYPSSYSIARFAKKCNKKIFTTQHIGFIRYNSVVARTIEGIVYSTMGRYLFKISKKIFVLNPEVESYIGTKGADKNKIVYLINGVDTKLFKPVNSKKKKELRKKHNLSSNKKIIVFVGRLVEKKGFDKLFDARNHDNITLFVGGGDVPLRMQNQEGVIFLGELTQEKLSGIYQLSDVFCLPSHGEGFPLSIQEAMASELPVITTKNPNYKRYVNSSNSVLINSSVRTLRIAISKVLSSRKKTLKLKKEARKKALQDFSWGKNVTNLERFYLEVKNEKN